MLDDKNLRLNPVWLGKACLEEGRLDLAEAYFRKALRRQPDRAKALVCLGGLYEERGELATAEASYRESLRASPNFAIPHARLAILLRGRLPLVDQRALENRLADGELAPGCRERLLFALANVLDARGEYARAADCLRRANQLTIQHRPRFCAYEPEEHERFVDNLLSAMDRSFFERLAATGESTQRPVFVFGLPRSGTTLVEQVLASHSQVFAAGELLLSPHTFAAIPNILSQGVSPSEALAQLNPTSVEQLARPHLAELAAVAPADALRIVDKLPDNYLYLGLLAVLFPQATFIHVRRDLRDTALSCWMTDFRIILWANAANHIAGRIRQYVRLMCHWRTVLPVFVHEIEYEQFVSEPEIQVQRLVAACGLRWEPACLAPHLAQRPVRTASRIQVREPIYQRSVARWKHYAEPLADLFAKIH